MMGGQGLPETRTGPDPASDLLSISRFCVWFDGRLVLRNINLNIPSGQFVAVIGPSGSGKSTLMNCVAGFIQDGNHTAIDGNISINGSAPQSRGLRRGVVFQEYALFPWRTARRNVEFALAAAGVPAAERKGRALDYLKLVQLENSGDLFPHQMSGGMKQRVAIARALAFQPDMLLMDEPLGAIDAITRDRLVRLIDEVWRETRKTVLYITHNVSEAVALADRVIVLKSNPGEIILDQQIELPRPRDALSGRAVELERLLRETIPQDDGAQEDGRAEAR
ncbi:MAG TPA: ABC transporter ATP-binding protein [Streptosporangiaceae bacterium]|nr:ABC transporter ATP-binding protein [Streptosporangiaceae bacterium]